MRNWPIEIKNSFERVVFLDRDGTINIDSHYPYKEEDLIFIDKSLDAIKILSDLDLGIIVVTNQAGIALGYYSEEDMSNFNSSLREKVCEYGGRIDAFYFCPHLEMGNLSKSISGCDCSKPLPAMLFEAQKDFGFSMKKSYLIGDKITDIMSGISAGCQTYLVLTGKGGKDNPNSNITPHFITQNLYEASLLISEDIREIQD